MIAIIDYGAGNIHSIEKALEQVGAEVRVTDDPQVVGEARAVVLPGVGAGGTAMARMKERGLDDAIRNATQQGKPFLGICLGMQLLAQHHDEGEVAGLGLFSGEVQAHSSRPENSAYGLEPGAAHCTTTCLSLQACHPMHTSILCTLIMSNHMTSMVWRR